MRHRLKAIRGFIGLILTTALYGLLWPFKQVFRGVCFVGRGIWRVMRGIGRMFMAVIHGIIATPGAIWRTPMRMYRRSVVWRNWVLEKVEYLQSESAKWKATFNILKSPYSFLRMMGLSPQMAVGLLAVGGTTGGGVIINETILAEPSFSKGDHGIYTAPSDIPIVYSNEDNTLRVDLGTTPVGEIVIENVSVGTAYANSALPSGQTNVVMVGGTAASSGFTATWLEVGHLKINRWRCDTFEMSDVEAHTLNIKYNASDGQSIAPVAGTPRARAIGGGNRADSMITSGGTYDQIRIGAPTSATNGKVDVLELTNLLTKGGKCLLSRIKAGTIDVEFMETGLGNGFATKEFVVATSTKYKIANIADNVEESISPP